MHRWPQPTPGFLCHCRAQLRPGRTLAGASFGGTIMRDRTFFFGDYQGRRIRTSETYLSPVHRPWEIRGNFSGLPAGSSSTKNFDSAAIMQFMGNNNASLNVIPSWRSPTGGVCLDPAALNHLHPRPLLGQDGGRSATARARFLSSAKSARRFLPHSVARMTPQAAKPVQISGTTSGVTFKIGYGRL